MLHIIQRFLWFLLVACTAPVALQAQDTAAPVYELRIYYCHPGKLALLTDRFDKHTRFLFEKQGMVNVGYWLPVDNKDSALYYILRYPSIAAREASWKAFNADPEWVKVRSQYEAAGPIVKSVTAIFMATTDFSPTGFRQKTSPPRLFELRTYTSPEGKHANIQERFRKYTMKIFENNGMENGPYFSTLPSDGTQPVLIYLLAHKDSSAAAASWKSFLVDPQWIKVKTASEVNGPIISKLESVYLKPLPFSPIQ